MPLFRIAAAALTALLASAILGTPVGASDSASVATPPAGEVNIYRDEWGVPHIYAATEDAGFYGLGYAQAHDLLEFMLAAFARFAGQAAEWGADPSAAGEDALVEMDVQNRTWRHLAEAKAGMSRLSPQLLRNYSAFLAGFKHYMRDHPERVPGWAPELELAHVLAFTRAVIFDYSIRDAVADCRAGGVQTAAVERMEHAAAQFASNEWVVAPWRTADNATVVLGDPHGGIDGASFHEFRMNAGELHVSGYTFGPLMLLTHNENVSWGMTAGMPDVSDCYEIEVEAGNPNRYRFGDEWREIKRETFTIAVKGKPPVSRQVEYAEVNGIPAPILARIGNKAFAAVSSYMQAAGLFDEEMYRMNKAADVDEVKAANQLNGIFPHNLMVGDRAGNIYYLRAGRTPRRSEAFDWTAPVPGNDPQAAWQGIHPVEDLVQVTNPKTGYLQNQNTPPDNITRPPPVVSAKDYPSYIFNATPRIRFFARAERSNDYLSRAFSLTFEEAQAFSVDETWVYALRWRDKLAEAVNTMPAQIATRPKEFRLLLHRLLAFDGVADKGSSAALLFYHWRSALHASLDDKQLKALSDAVAGEQSLPRDLAQPLIAAAEAAGEVMKSRYGSLDKTYGDVFRIGRTPERSWPVGGGPVIDTHDFYRCMPLQKPAFECAITMRAFIMPQETTDGIRLVSAGSRVLRLVQFTEPLKSFTLHNFGQSGDPQSPHYDDQAQHLTSAALLKPTYFNPGELEGHVESSVTLRTTVQ